MSSPVTHAHPLEPLFSPRSVAVVGVSAREGSLGRLTFANLLQGGLQASLYPVNPHRTEVLGQRCYPSLAAIGAPVDLAVIATPAATVPGLIEEAHRAGVRAAVILAAGFSGGGAHEEARARRVREAAARYGIRILGPHCFGLMRPGIGLNATFSRSAAHAGSIAVVSQSGAIASALLDAAWPAGIGLSALVTLGDAVDLDFGQILDYLQYDHATRSILLYLEQVRDARRFISGLRACARSKPIVLVKAGRHAGPGAPGEPQPSADAVFDAVVRRCGAVRLRTYNELLSAARVLGSGRIPQGGRLALVSNGRGPSLLAADACAERGVLPAQFAEPTRSALRLILPAESAPDNPLDILGDAGPERFAGTLASVLADPGVDGVLTLFCPQGRASAREVAEGFLPLVEASGKPLLSAWLGEHDAQPARAWIETSGIPAFSSPESGVAAFAALAEYQRAQRQLLEVAPPLARQARPETDRAQAMVQAALGAGRLELAGTEALGLLACFGIRAAPEAAGADALQLTLGLSADPVFGPVLWLGTRPCAAIPAGETAVGLPPLSPTLAESMLEAAQIRCAPESPGGLPPALYEALADALLHLSDLAVALPAVGTLQIQLACGSSGVAAMGAQARLDPERAPPDRHYRHMAIHPYPAGLEQQIRLADGTLLPVRPIRPEDAGIERAFVENLSDQSRYMRFFGPTRQLSARMLARLTQVDYDRELALIALSGPEPDCGMVGVARFSPLPDEGACEFALAVADAYQRRGLGKVLMQRLISAAREAGYRRMCGAILGTNTPMIALARRLGFTLQSDPQDMTVLQAERPLA